MSGRRAALPLQDHRRIAGEQVVLAIGRGWYDGWAWSVTISGAGTMRGWHEDRAEASRQAADALARMLPAWRPV